MKISRATFLKVAFAAPFSIAARPLFAQAPDTGDRERIGATIREFDGQGFHRTATDVDHASAEWLHESARAAGAASTLDPFSLNRVDVRAAYVEIDGRRIDGVPLFDGTFTDPRGINGLLGLPGSGADVSLVTFDAAAVSSEGQAIADLRRSPAHRAILVMTNSAAGQLALTNAALFQRPYGCPVLQIGPEQADELNARARAGGSIRLVAHAVRTPATAYNVVATVGRIQSGTAPVIVMTPRSGWWHCASERGGGIACWLETIRAVSAARLQRPVLFVASSGHELGHQGLDAFLLNRPGLIKQAIAWIHLGANIGAAGGRMRIQASDGEMELQLAAALDSAGEAVEQRVPRGTVPAGEARNIHLGGGRYVSLLGTGPSFHTIGDRWPAAVDVDAVGRCARAIAALAVTAAS